MKTWEKPNPLTAENLAEWRVFLEPFSPSAQVLAQLEKLRKPNALCVVAGQQAGLLGGPLLTVYKALSALHWARKLEKQLKRPVVPIFWIASDDHDFAEIAPLRWLGAGRTVSNSAITQRKDDAGKSVFDSKLIPGEWANLRQELEASGLTDPQVLAEFDSFTPTDSASVEDQFLHFFLRWFGTLGVVPLAPRIPFLRRRAAELYAQEIERPTASTNLLLEGEALLAELGLENAGIHRKGGELNFFWHNPHGRCRLEWQQAEEPTVVVAYHPLTGKAVWEGQGSELLELIKNTPEAFSPNAALRPLVQDLALPTIAFIGGPSELVYHGQLAGLYPMFQVKRPVCVPRVSITLFPKPLMRYLNKFGLTPKEALSVPLEKLELHLAQRVEQGKVLGELDETFDLIDQKLSALNDELSEVNDPRLLEYVEKLSTYLKRGREKLARRTTLTLSARAASQEVHWNQVKETLFPNEEPQERVLTAFPFLIQELGANAAERLSASVDATAWQEPQIVDLVLVPEFVSFGS